LAPRLAGDQRHRHPALGEREEQLESPVGGGVGERDLDAVVAAARVEAMGRRIRVAEARGAVALHPEARGRRRAGPRAGTVPEAPCISHAIEQLRVTERDLAGLAWRNREYARPQQAVTGQLDQGRVAFAAHDVLVNRARLA